MRRKHSQRGFTLLEVLVAFIIAALALGAMFSAVLGGLRTATVADHLQEAVTLARSRLAASVAALDAGVATQGQHEGDDGSGFHWVVKVRTQAGVVMPRADDAAPTAAASRATLFAISVVVSWTSDGGDRQVRLDGARLEAGPAPAT